MASAPFHVPTAIPPCPSSITSCVHNIYLYTVGSVLTHTHGRAYSAIPHRPGVSTDATFSPIFHCHNTYILVSTEGYVLRQRQLYTLPYHLLRCISLQFIRLALSSWPSLHATIRIARTRRNPSSKHTMELHITQNTGMKIIVTLPVMLLSNLLFFSAKTAFLVL